MHSLTTPACRRNFTIAGTDAAGKDGCIGRVDAGAADAFIEGARIAVIAGDHAAGNAFAGNAGVGGGAEFAVGAFGAVVNRDDYAFTGFGVASRAVALIVVGIVEVIGAVVVNGAHPGHLVFNRTSSTDVFNWYVSTDATRARVLNRCPI